MSDQRNVTLAELLNRARANAMKDLRVAVPGRVESYDSSTQTADIKPMVGDQFQEEDGSTTDISLPIISKVPVIFPGAGSFRITFPVTPGDTVLLVFSDRSIDGWLDQGGESFPSDRRRHHLSDAVAIPGLHPNNAPWNGAEDGVITLGSDSGSADFVALASAVSSQLSTLKAAISGAAVTAGDGGASFKAAIMAALSTWPGSVASSTVKIKG